MIEISDDFAISFRQNKFETMKWSKEENNIKVSRNHREIFFPKYILTFSNALLLALRKSVFGCYLDELNPQQNQDKNINENKLTITDYIIKNLKDKEMKIFKDRNDLFESTVNVLKGIVEHNESVNMEHLVKNIKNLRLTDYYINQIDPGLKTISNLQLLMLSGNNIKDVEGALLPRNLKFLELYDNFIANLTNIVRKAPKGILHLGLGRNRLTDDCSCHLLSGSRSFAMLLSLDLSENDIYNLNAVLGKLRGLDSLRALQLEGNPCYVVPDYKNTVLQYLPNLVYLDNVEITEEDRKINEFLQVEDKEPRVIFFCHRIMGLRPPPRDARNNQTIHIEFELPLLEEVHLAVTKSEKKVNVPDKSTKNVQTLKKGKSEKPNSPESPTNHSSKKSKKAKKHKSPYDSPNEYEAHCEENNFSFKTARLPWNSVMEFSPVFIESPEHDAKAIRDTFRSTVEVRVVYLKTSLLPKVKSKKQQKSAKVKKSQTESSVRMNSPEEKPKQNILKRVTLCSFNCDLRSVNWSDETIDYHWADHPKIGIHAIRMDGCLKNVIYGKSVDKKKTKEIPGEDPQESQNVIQSIPKIFTCQVGFGLKRM